MSIHYSAYVIRGFKLDIADACQLETRYNEKTGEPYEVLEKTHSVAKIDGVIVATNEDNEDAFCSGEEIESLELVKSGYDDGQLFLGYQLAYTDEYAGYFKEFHDDIPKEVKDFEEKHRVQSQLYLVLKAG